MSRHSTWMDIRNLPSETMTITRTVAVPKGVREVSTYRECTDTPESVAMRRSKAKDVKKYVKKGVSQKMFTVHRGCVNTPCNTFKSFK